MILNLLLVVLLVWAFFIGYSRGLILQIIYSAGTLIATLIAAANYKVLMPTLSTWVPFSSATAGTHLRFFSDALLFKLDEAFYAGLSFLLIYIGVCIIIRIIGLFLTFSSPILGRKGRIISGILSLCATYFGLQMFLILLALVPIASIQNVLHASILVQLMVLHTPISSNLIQHLFIENIVHLNPLG